MPEIKIRNAKDLEKVLKIVVKNALEDTGEDMVDVVKEEIYSTVYSSYLPVSYERTGDLAESLESTKATEDGNSINVEVKHNTDKIYSVAPNQHYSVVDGRSSSESIAEIVHNGLAPNIFNGEDYPWMHRRPYMDDAKERLKKYKEHIDAMKKYLKKQGIKTE